MAHLVMVALTVFALLVTTMHGQDRQQDCFPCRGMLPCVSQDGTFTAILTDSTTIGNCVGMVRTMIDGRGGSFATQAITFKIRTSPTECRDSVVPASRVSSITVYSIGIGGQPCAVPIRPLIEYSSNEGPRSSNMNFLEIDGYAGYGGSDTSTREVGFASLYFGAEAWIAPFGTLLGDKLQLALGAGVLSEGGRLRLPAMGQLRYTFLGGSETTSSLRYVPDACQFNAEGRPKPSTSQGTITMRDGYGERDSSSYVIQEDKRVYGSFRPYVYAEGGLIFNLGFEGAGAEPSVNSEDYGQFLLGGGVGLPIAEILNVSLGYRYMRLNLRTPCAVCPPDETGEADNYFVLNTNSVHSVLLKIGVHFPW
jgi:hypothetical protein